MINLTTNDKYETLGQIKTVTPIAEGYECMLADVSRILTKLFALFLTLYHQ